MNRSEITAADIDLWWKILESFKWSENSHRSPDSIARETVLNTPNKYKLVHACQYARDIAFRDLSKTINAYEKHSGKVGQYGGDDSFSDMVWQVIGMGRKFYEAVLANPRILDTMAVKESFSYCMVDTVEELEKFTLEYHRENAYRCLGHLYMLDLYMAEGNYVSEHDQQIIKELKERFVSLVNNDVESATRGFVGLPSPAGYSDIYKRYYEWDANQDNAMYANLLHDAARCLIDDTTPTQIALL